MPFRFQTAATLIVLTTLAGCTGFAPTGALLPPPADCGASELQQRIGQLVAGTSAADAMLGGEPVRSRGQVRVIAPGQAVIQNYSELRLNLEVDEEGSLLRANCG